jgi:methylphosphotriester-DNA--protein-cysteine methyltransferase
VRQTTLSRRRALFDEALAEIELQYADATLSLGAVARSIATSRRQLQRVFGERRTSFREELQRVRMTRAAELLRQGGTPISKVAPGGLPPARAVLEGLSPPPRLPAVRNATVGRAHRRLARRVQ